MEIPDGKRLDHEIERMRHELYAVGISRSFTNKKILPISMRLDQLLVEYQKKNKTTKQ